jgi:hypothetical protein
MMKSKKIKYTTAAGENSDTRSRPMVQQYDIIKDSAVRGAMIGNSEILSTHVVEPEKLAKSPDDSVYFFSVVG